MNDIIKKNKKNQKNKSKEIQRNKSKYMYFSILGIFLLVGISYAFIFFMERFEGSDLGMVTALLDVSISNNGVVSIDNANTQKDTEGINNDKTTFTIVNNNQVPIRVIIKLVEDHNSNLNKDSVRFGVLGSGEILNVNSLGKSDGIIYDFFMEPGQNATLETTLWLDYYYQGGNISEIFSGKYVVEASNANQFAMAYLSDLVDKNKGLYAINEDGTLNTGTGTIKEYRYSGLTPDNYVYFNNEVWRIVSVSSDGSLKIVRNEEITMANYPGNDEYYNSINEAYREYILKSNFNVGVIDLDDTYTTLLTKEANATSEGYVNYINTSDYLYSTAPTYYTSALNSTDVSSNTWLAGTYLTANGINGTDNVLGINQNIPTATTSTDETYSIKPCVYLKKTVSIVDGYGTLEQPYVLDYADVKTLVEPPTIVDTVINKVGTDGIVAINTSGALATDGDTIREYRYSGSARYCTYTIDGTTYQLEVDTGTCPNACDSGTSLYRADNESITVSGNSCSSEVVPNETKSLAGSVKNYAWFNNEMWRIVGVFKETTGTDDEVNLVKLVRDEPLKTSEVPDTYSYNNVLMSIKNTPYGKKYTGLYWNYSNYFNQTNSSDWTKASLQYYLNDETAGVTSYYNSINKNYRKMIETVLYNLGNISPDVASGLYDDERSEIFHTGSETTWLGKIGLLYPSDYGYGANNSAWTTNISNYGSKTYSASLINWINDDVSMYDWFISPVTYSPIIGAMIYPFGYVSFSNLNNGHCVSPVLYLKADVATYGGDGSYDNPYKLG